MAIDRAAALRRAEQLVRRGQIEAAIADYTGLLDEQPRDWTVANLLGDLLVRAGDLTRAARCFADSAGILAAEGFDARACAVYRKILKLYPDDDQALVQAARLSAAQGLVADARQCYDRAARGRQQRGDHAGAEALREAMRSLEVEHVAGPIATARPGPMPPTGPALLPGPAAPPVSALFDSAPAGLRDDPGDAPGTVPGAEPDTPVENEPASADPHLADPHVADPGFAGPDIAEPGIAAPDIADPDIETVFARLRRETAAGADDATAQLSFARGTALIQAGDPASGAAALRAAARSPRFRAVASLQLARMFDRQQQVADAIEWFGHALDAADLPAAERSAALLRLAELLEAQGEVAGALAACLELQAHDAGYGDLMERLARLTARVGG